jgi:hypothetical protein
MSNTPPIRFSHNHHLLAVKGCEAEPDVLAFDGDEALSDRSATALNSPAATTASAKR